MNIDILSDGGSSRYYTFRLNGKDVETEDVIATMVSNDFDLGNIVKCARRIAANREGEGKVGASQLYDWKKIEYTAQKMIRRIEDEDQS